MSIQTLNLTRENNYNAAVAELHASGIAFSVTPHVESPDDVYRSDLDSTVDGVEYGFGFYQWETQTSVNPEEASISWVNDKLTISSPAIVRAYGTCGYCEWSEKLQDLKHTGKLGCAYGTTEYCEVQDEWNEIDMYFSSHATAHRVAAAFISQGFTIEWDGDADSSFILNVND